MFASLVASTREVLLIQQENHAARIESGGFAPDC